VADTPSGARFRMLETVREFSMAEREATGETHAVIDRFLAWARDFSLAYRDAPFGPQPGQVLDRIRAEQDNLLHAMRYGISRGDGATVAATAAVLGALWMIDSSLTRMSALGGEPARVLSHYRPAPEFVEATRAAAALITGYEFTIQGPHAVRSLVVLRRLPPVPPDTPVRAIAAILRATPELDVNAVAGLSTSDQPVLAGAVAAVATYLREDTGDVAGALEAAAQMLEVFEHRDSPYLRIAARARLAELYMHVGDGERALPQLRAAWAEKDQLGNWPDMLGLRWAMVLASLQVGALDDAERWLELAGCDLADDRDTYHTFEVAVRGELLLARGEIEAGLLHWRRAVQLLVNDRLPGMRVEPGLEPWSLEIKAVTVIAHARHGRLDLVEELVRELPPALAAMLSDPGPGQVAFVTGLPLSGALLLAVGMVDLARAAENDDGRAARSGARLVALAERFGYLRQFQPTMSAAAAREAAEKADRPAYEEAVSSYAGLSLVDLRAAALAALAERP
jgi:tetratricopeptide (TPR) repeat protein